MGPDSKQAAQISDLLRQVNVQAAQMADVDVAIERGYAHLGVLLLEVSEMGYWRVKYDTFQDYLVAVAQIAKRTPAQLRRYHLTVRDLIDTFDPNQLEMIGITKAMRLCNAKETLLVLPPEAIAVALNPQTTVKDLKKVLASHFPEEEGDWMDLECEFMVSPEQRATIEQAFDVAMHTEPLTKSTISKSAQRLDVVMKLCMEFLGAHSGDGQ